MRYWVQLATEQFPPSGLVDQAIEVERADRVALPHKGDQFHAISGNRWVGRDPEAGSIVAVCPRADGSRT